MHSVYSSWQALWTITCRVDCVVSNKTIKLKMWCCNKNSTTDATGEADTVSPSGARQMPLVKQILFTLPEHDGCHWWSRYCLQGWAVSASPVASVVFRKGKQYPDATGEADTAYPSGAPQMPLVKQILFTLPEHDRCHWWSRYCLPFRSMTDATGEADTFYPSGAWQMSRGICHAPEG
jgi:hypothetical protein